jgi:hypothetical protein
MIRHEMVSRPFREIPAGRRYRRCQLPVRKQQGQILEQVLKQCGDDLSRENILKQARSIRGLSLPTLIPGVVVNTGPGNSMAYTQLQLQRGPELRGSSSVRS